MKSLPIYLFLFLPFMASTQQWQQETNYKIDVRLDDATHTLNGKLALEYKNQSPDTLRFIYFHLWPNAYKNENTAFAKQIFRNKSEGKQRWKRMKDKGYIDSLDFHVDGRKATVTFDAKYEDIVRVDLATPLAPNKSVAITTPFFVKIPTYSSRSGHVDQSYIICQWYPKPAVYDKLGWHAFPYLDQGEFYGEFGSFEVNITLPSTYVIGASGTLTNQDELDRYREIGSGNLQNNEQKKYQAVTAGTKTLQYKADRIHDFAWFADKDFIIRYDTAKLASGAVIDVFTYGHAKGNRYWKNSVDYTEDAVRKYSSWIGEYPYPVVQAVEGPANVTSGGMEYPMITLITSPTADEPHLDGVIAHEVGHNWFYGILASNERDHAWMDEGINTYYQFRYEAEKYRANTVFGNAVPAAIKSKNVADFQAEIYNALAGIPMEPAIETTSAAFTDKDTYATVVYLKTAIWMYMLELSLGRDTLDKAIQTYYSTWKFRHPYPGDLKATLENQVGQRLDHFFDLLNKKGTL